VIRRSLDDIVEEGEFTYEELETMIDYGQVQGVPPETMFGSREYDRGINCEWQGREIEMLKEMRGQ